MLDSNKPMFGMQLTIKLCRFSMHLLKKYEKLEFFVPRRDNKNNRIYSLKDVQYLKFIRRFIKELNFEWLAFRVIFLMAQDLRKYNPHVKNIAPMYIIKRYYEKVEILEGIRND